MEAKAIGRYLRVTPRKARFVLDTVRGKSAREALAMLKFVPNEAARYVTDVIESAAANAEHNFAMDRDALRITRAYVDQGPMMKRVHPRAMGRAFRILKRMCHITVVVSEDESLKTVAKGKAGVQAGRKTAVVGKESTAKPRAKKATAGSAAPAKGAAKTKRSASAPKSEE